jgi:L-lactate dehydrogenase
MEERKIAIIGDGAVGSSIAYTLMLGHGVSEIALVDVNKDKAIGDALDMADGMSFLSTPKKVVAGDYDVVKGAHIIVITAGSAQKPGETRMDLLARNAHIFDSILGSLAPYIEPETIVLVVSNPVDILSYYVYKKLHLPASQVLGSGTVLDTSRLKTAISEDTMIDPRSVHTMIVGEHGDSEVPVWSATSLGGLSLVDYCSKCNRCSGKRMSRLNELHEKVKNAAYEIIAKKGATNYAVALAVSRIVSAILNDENSVLTVSTYLESGFEGTLSDLYLALPCVVGGKGVEKILHPNYTIEEKSALIASGLSLKEKLKDLPL